MLRSDPSVAIRALRSAAPYIRMYKGKVFVIKASGGVFGDPATTRGLIEQVAILHQVGIRVVLVHGGGPQLTQVQEVARPHAAHGRGPARHRRQVDGSHQHGAERAGEHADPGHLPRAGHRRGRRQRRRCRARARPQASAGERRGPGRRLRLRRRHRSDRREGAAAAARRRPDAGRQPGLRGRQGHAAEHQRRHGRGGHRRGPEGREADAVHRRARHSRIGRRSALDRLVHRPRRARSD